MLKTLTLLLGSGLFLFALSGSAETITQKRISATIKLVPLQKLTVGPFDQYQGVVDPSGRFLVFTRKSDLIPHLCRQDLSTGEVTDVLPRDADSQEPAISSDGKLAFSYYKRSASGEICYRTAQNAFDVRAVPTCLKTGEGVPSTPFWKSDHELGYLLKENWSQKGKVISENIETGAKEVLAEGEIGSPFTNASGTLLFYNRMMISPEGSEKRVLAVKDLTRNREQILRIDLPGISGFPAVSIGSDAEPYLFFSHYLNDTNHDNVIDGNDNSVIFRLPMGEIFSDRPLFPEQLTSVESNCSFPRIHRDKLFVSCAFEGALDIYQIPTSGTVPPQWNQDVLENAHATARSYADRLLILNTMKYRQKKGSGSGSGSEGQNVSLVERILSNHLMADDLASSQYYLDQLQQKADPELREFYSLLTVYLKARELKKVQVSDEITLAFERAMADTTRKIDQKKGFQRFRIILKGLIETFLNRPDRAAEALKKVQFKGRAYHAFEKLLYFELANWTLPRVRGTQKVFSQGMDPVYHEMMSASELSHESKIYYAFQYLGYLQNVTQGSLRSRENRIEGMSRNLPAPVLILLESEKITLKIIEAPEAEKAKVYQDLDRLMSQSREDYFLRKALSIRSILNFAQAQEFRYLGFIASNWLKYTRDSDTEFAYAREVYSTATLDRAYDALGEGKRDLAANYFFGSLSLTDDLESHYGYIELMHQAGKRSLIDERYKNLANHQQIDDNLKYVQALLILMDSTGGSRTDTQPFDRAFEKLKAMTQDRDSSVRYLLMGYCRLEKVFRTASGYEFDWRSYEEAHQYLMLAYDQAWDNERVRISALTDLGLLHQRVRNYGLAEKYFSKRRSMPFLNDEERVRLSWFYSRTLYFNHQEEQAYREITQALRLKFSGSKIPFLERKAFYAMNARKFKDAASSYRELLAHENDLGALNPVKVYLAYGYSLFKLGERDQSRGAFQKSLSHLGSLTGSQALRMRLILLGLLAQTDSKGTHVQHLEERGIALEHAKSLLDEWPSTVIKNDLQLALEYQRKGDLKNAVQSTANALQEAKNFVSVGGDPYAVSPPVTQTVIAGLTQALLYPEPFKSLAPEIDALAKRSLEAFSSLKGPSTALAFQKEKIDLLYSAFREGSKFHFTRSQSNAYTLEQRQALEKLQIALEERLR